MRDEPFQIIPQGAWEEPERLLAQQPVTEELRRLLTCRGSLTRTLEFQWQDQVTVRLFQQHLVFGLEPPDPVLWTGLELPVWQEGVVIRDAWLAVAGAHRVFAHSRLELNGLSLPVQDAIRLGRRPLGDLFLESEERISRQHLGVTQALAPALATRLGYATGHLFWCRRSLLQVGEALRGGIVEVIL